MLRTSIVLAALAITGCASGPHIEQAYLARYATGGLHTGIDLSGYVGQEVRAPRAGRVAYAQPNEGSIAARITIDHVYQGQDYQTQYYHLADPLVHTGQWVKQGDVIARLALTGARGPYDSRIIGRPHLHLELYRDSRRGDPERMVPWACPTKDRPEVEWRWPVGC